MTVFGLLGCILALGLSALLGMLYALYIVAFEGNPENGEEAE